MTTALQQVLERIGRLSEQLSPEEQASATEQLKQLADQLEREREWNNLLSTPESQAYLAAREREVLAELAAGKQGVEEEVGHRQEIARPDFVCMVVQEGGPCLRGGPWRIYF